MLKVVVRLILVALAMVAQQAASAAPPSYITATLHASSNEPAAGRTTMLAIKMVPKDGWHGYWSNPGDSGFPPKVSWTLPPGVKIGSVQHPAPEVLKVVGMTSFVHGGQHILLTPMIVPASFKSGDSLPIRGKIDFLACSDSLCVPQSASVSLDLKVGSGAPDAGQSALFTAAKRAIPARLGAKAKLVQQGSKIELSLPETARLDPRRTTFFPDGEGVFNKTGSTRLPDGTIRIEGTLAGAANGVRSGVVSDGRSAYRVSITKIAGTIASADGAELIPAQDAAAEPAAMAYGQEPAQIAPGSSSIANESDGSSAPPSGLLIALWGAFLGGLILNLMPCVFPILSMKALHLAKAGHSARGARSESLAYAAGTIGMCMALGLVLIILRELGVAAGWSFQLQNPYVILFLLVVVTAIALNFAGLFHVQGPSIAGKPTSGGVGSSFGTGAMAAFVATPCSAPFMASALGAAMLLPAASALTVFAFLGLGLALPFVLLGWIPALRKLIPKPGDWMIKFQRVLAVPMFATALGLSWILARQVGADGMVVGLGSTLLIALALWWVGSRQRRGCRRSWLPLLPAALLAAGTATIVPATARTPSSVPQRELVETFSEKRLQALRAQGTPVFVDFTADWCLTCKVNEKTAIDRSRTQDAFREHGVVTLVGDWTRGDPEITRFLASHDRNSIPFYLFYAPNASPKVLPQILTVDLLVELAQSARNGGRPDVPPGS